jgi:nitrous oxidase accessory protein NosD
MLRAKRLFGGVLLLITSWLIMGATGHATTLTVGQPNTACPNAQYTTISAAITAASPGDVIEICPALYAEQLIITKPLTLRGILTHVNIENYLPCCNEVKRVLLQPNLQDLQGLPFEAVITVMNTTGVTIDNLAIDASQNTVASCDIVLSAVHFFNASGQLVNSAALGAKLPSPQSCSGNGFGVVVDSSQAGPFHIEIENNSIHDFQRGGIIATNAGINATIQGNNVSGLGPATRINQFGIAMGAGAVGQIKSNIITEGNCGKLSPNHCSDAQSFGVVLHDPGDGAIVDNNVINHVQSGVFFNGGNRASITNNLIGNIDLLDGIDMLGASNSLVSGNTIFNATPLTNLSEGVFEAFGGGEGNNTISNNTVNDAYCGVAFVATSHVTNNKYFNVLYPELATPNGQPIPPPTEPPLP